MEKEKFLIFDSSAIISLALNNLLYLLERLKKIFPGKFIITQEVKREIIDVPLKIKKYKLEAMMISELIKNNVLELAENIISKGEILKKTSEICEKANHLFQANNQYLKIIS
jgi:hypothetical protein